MAAQASVVVVGSTNVDLISYVAKIPVVGETVRGENFSQGFGGKGANQAVMAARMGASVAMITMVGDDSFGRDARDNFIANKVCVDGVLTCADSATGVAPIIVDQSGGNVIVVALGANEKLTAEHVADHANTIALATVCVCQLEILPATTIAALKTARAYETKTIFNAAPARLDITRSEWDTLLELCDILCVNESECETITGIAVGSESAINPDDLANAVKQLHERGARAVVVTLGSSGAFWSETNGGHGRAAPQEKVSAIDTTGAGDCFVGALAYYLSRSGGTAAMELGEAVVRAVQVATLSVCAKGTQTSYPHHENIPQHLLM